MVELNRNADGTPGPVTVVCSSLNFLMRTQESILIHELMHVQGIGMQQSKSHKSEVAIAFLLSILKMATGSLTSNYPTAEHTSMVRMESGYSLSRIRN